MSVAQQEAFELAVAIYVEQDGLYGALLEGVYTSPAIEALEERFYVALRESGFVESAVYDYCLSEGLI